MFHGRRRFSDIGTGTWRDVSYATLVSMATPAGKCLACLGARLATLPHIVRRVKLWPSPCAAFAPLSYSACVSLPCTSLQCLQTVCKLPPMLLCGGAGCRS